MLLLVFQVYAYTESHSGSSLRMLCGCSASSVNTPCMTYSPQQLLHTEYVIYISRSESDASYMQSPLYVVTFSNPVLIPIL